MHKARHAAKEHRNRETRRLEHVPPIGLTNFVEVVGEKRHLEAPRRAWTMSSYPMPKRSALSIFPKSMTFEAYRLSGAREPTRK